MKTLKWKTKSRFILVIQIKLISFDLCELGTERREIWDLSFDVKTEQTMFGRQQRFPWYGGKLRACEACKFPFLLDFNVESTSLLIFKKILNFYKKK